MTNNPTAQQQAIYNVLIDYISEEDVNDALVLWQNTFAGIEAAYISRSIDDFLIKLSKHKTLMLSILRIRARLLEGLSNVSVSTPSSTEVQATKVTQAPTPQANETDFQRQPESSASSGNQDPLIQVFSALLLNIVGEFKQNSGNKDFPVKQVLSGLNITDLEKNDLESILSDPSKGLNLVYAKSSISIILISFYNACTDELGAAKAGDCLSSAMQKTSQIEAAKIIPPASLL